jgi:formate-dependent nitrite reductase cytochrome c552 subunit
MKCKKPRFANQFYYANCKARLDSDKEWKRKPRIIRQTKCKLCHNRISREYTKNNPDVRALSNYRESDKRRGLTNDLTRDFVREALSKPCHYCLRKFKRMTLDRMNNNIGHVMTNIVTCCSMCNMLKRDLPYEAWMLMVPGLRQACERGLLDHWVDSDATRTGCKFKT